MPVSGGETNRNEPPEEQTKEEEDRVQEDEEQKLVDGEVSLKQWEIAEYAVGRASLDEKEPDKIVYSLTMPLIPKSDDADVYLFAKE